MRAWWGLVLAAVLIGTAYAADAIVSRMIEEGRAMFSSLNAIAIEGIVRVAVVALMVALAWLVFRGPRTRPIGLAMALVGFVVGLVPPLSLVILSNGEIALPSLLLDVMLRSTEFTLWAATAVLVLGVVEIADPTRDPIGVAAAPELAGGPT